MSRKHGLSSVYQSCQVVWYTPLHHWSKESHPFQLFLPRCKCKFGDAGNAMLSLLQGLELRGVQQIFDGQNHVGKAPEVHRMAVSAQWTWKGAIGSIVAHRWIWTNPRVVHAVLHTRDGSEKVSIGKRTLKLRLVVPTIPNTFWKLNRRMVPSLKNHSSGRKRGAPLVKRGRLAMAPMPPWISLIGPMVKVSRLRMVLLARETEKAHPSHLPNTQRHLKNAGFVKTTKFERVRKPKKDTNSETLTFLRVTRTVGCI